MIGTISVALQGIYNMATDEVVAYEALARRIADDGSVLTPGHFMAGATERDWVDLDQEMAAALLMAVDSFDSDKYLFVNVSEYTLASAVHFVKWQNGLQILTKRKRIKVVVEFPERSDIPFQVLVSRMNCLRQGGFKVALDDFGSSHANLDRLISHQWDFCKVERDSVIHVDRREESILAIEFCQLNGITVILERLQRQATPLTRPATNRGLWVQGFDWGVPTLVESSDQVVRAYS